MNVKIIRVLNTNAVVSVDSQGIEMIKTDPGIGFKKRKGENNDQSLVDKTYHLENKEESKRLQEVVKEISEEYLGIADRVVKEAKKEKLEIRDSLYVTLTDHINFAIERVSQGIEPQNALLWEIKRFYPQEFQLGIYALELIQDRLDILLPEDEAGFIALHFVNAEYGTDIRDAVKFPDQMQAIVDIVERDLGILLDESSLHYERFMTHIKFLIQRIYRKELLFSEDRELSLLMQRKYPREYQCSVKVAEYIMQATGSRLSEEEIMYLSVHIRRVTT